MKKISTLIIFFCGLLLFSQKVIEQIVINQYTEETIPNLEVRIGNFKTVSNINGKVMLEYLTLNDSVFIDEYGWKPLKTTMESIVNSNNIYLEEDNMIEEVVVFSGANIIKNINKNINKNYPASKIDEAFFYRELISENTQYVVLRETIGNTIKPSGYITFDFSDFDVKLLNERKSNDYSNESFNFKPFSPFSVIGYGTMYPITEKIKLKPIQKIGNSFLKLEIIPSSDKYTNKNHYWIKSSGAIENSYIIVNLDDYAIVKVHINSLNESILKKESTKYRYKKQKYNVDLIDKGYIMEYTFKKDSKLNKYIIDKISVKGSYQVEDKQKDLKLIYDYNQFYYVLGLGQEGKTKGKKLSQGDLLQDIKMTYNPSLWNNELIPMTSDELKAFKKVQETPLSEQFKDNSK